VSDEPAPEPTPVVRDKHAPGIGMPATLYLLDFGQVILEAFGEIPFHVGSSLPGSGRPGWRDVDVRLMLPDERYEAEGYGDPERPYDNAKWVAMVKAFSLLGRHMTGLPINFQIQQRTQANKEYGKDTPGHQRSSLFSHERARSNHDMFERGVAVGKADTESTD